MFNPWRSSVLKWQIQKVCVWMHATLNGPNLLCCTTRLWSVHWTSNPSMLQTPFILQNDHSSQFNEVWLQGHYNEWTKNILNCSLPRPKVLIFMASDLSQHGGRCNSRSRLTFALGFSPMLQPWKKHSYKKKHSNKSVNLSKNESKQSWLMHRKERYRLATLINRCCSKI